jgi:hypothetical protein
MLKGIPGQHDRREAWEAIAKTHAVRAHIPNR